MQYLPTATILALSCALAGCVAPEEAPAPKYVPQVAGPTTGQFDSAPTPNRAIGRPSSDEVIRLAK